MHLSGKTFNVSGGETILIPANAVHNIKTISKYIIMRYYFPKGSFKDIKNIHVILQDSRLNFLNV